MGYENVSLASCKFNHQKYLQKYPNGILPGHNKRHIVHHQGFNTKRKMENHKYRYQKLPQTAYSLPGISYFHAIHSVESKIRWWNQNEIISNIFVKRSQEQPIFYLPSSLYSSNPGAKIVILMRKIAKFQYPINALKKNQYFTSKEYLECCQLTQNVRMLRSFNKKIYIQKE